jgi:ADP-heptose:LPS heptosyltransferase
MVKFLVVRFSSIGDIVLTTPVVRHLKQQVEDAEIHYLTKSAYASLLEANPYVDRIHAFDGDLEACIAMLRKEGIDYVIDLHHNVRSARIKYGMKRIAFSVHKLNWLKWLYVNFKIDRLPHRHMVDRNLDTIHSFIEEVDDGGLDYFIPEKSEVHIHSLPEPFRKGYVGLSIGAQHETKKLPVESLVKLCQKLESPVVILGGPEDQERGERLASSLPGNKILNGCGSYSIHQSASLVRQAKVLITNDTGLMHIGAAFHKKIISVWGNTVPRFGMFPYKADPSSVQFEVGGLSCRPCSKIGYQKCPRKHFKCMLEQDLDGMASTTRLLWNSP